MTMIHISDFIPYLSCSVEKETEKKKEKPTPNIQWPRWINQNHNTGITSGP
jgi:hypothetical protein